MVKQHKRASKTKTRKNFKGGDGSIGFPPSYFGNGLNGYFASGSKQLNSVGKQSAVSQGTISKDGTYAGPNLYPMKGGNCGCNKKQKQKTNSKSKQKNKSFKSRKMKKTNKNRR